MKHILICVFTLLLSIGTSSAQEDGFSLQLKSDTVLAGNVLQISFVANNVAGQFEGPDLKNFNVVNGPNTSSTMTMMNGTVTQHASYSYSIYFEHIGEAIIPPAYLITNEGTLETEPTSIIVLPNPEGIIEQPPSSSQSGMYQFHFPNPPREKKENLDRSTSKKKKRKLKKI